MRTCSSATTVSGSSETSVLPRSEHLIWRGPTRRQLTALAVCLTSTLLINTYKYWLVNIYKYYTYNKYLYLRNLFWFSFCFTLLLCLCRRCWRHKNLSMAVVRPCTVTKLQEEVVEQSSHILLFFVSHISACQGGPNKFTLRIQKHIRRCADGICTSELRQWQDV